VRLECKETYGIRGSYSGFSCDIISSVRTAKLIEERTMTIQIADVVPKRSTVGTEPSRSGGQRIQLPGDGLVDAAHVDMLISALDSLLFEFLLKSEIPADFPSRLQDHMRRARETAIAKLGE
jgi:hypothetical protein